MWIHSIGAPWRSALALALALQKSSIISQVIAAIEAEGLDKAVDTKPLIRGDELSRILGVEKKTISEAVNVLLEWQMEHPEAGVEEAQHIIVELWEKRSTRDKDKDEEAETVALRRALKELTSLMGAKGEGK